MASIHKTHVPLIIFTVCIMIYAFGGFLPDAYSQVALPENDTTRNTGLTVQPLDNDSSIRQTTVLSEKAPPQKESGTTESAENQEQLLSELSARLLNKLDKDVLTIAYKGLEQSQKNIDRSISILNYATGTLAVTATLLGVIVALFAVFITVASLFSYFKYKDTRELEKQIEQNAKQTEQNVIEANNKLKEAEKLVGEIAKLKTRAEDTVNSLTKLPVEKLLPEESKQMAKELEDAVERSAIMGIEQSPAQKAFIEATKLYYQGNYQDSLKEFEKVIKLKPDFPDPWHSKGVVLGKLGRCEDALKEFDKVLELKPYLYEAWYNKGVTLDRLGRYADALNAFDKAIRLKTDFYEAWYNKGNALDKLGSYANALNAFDKAIGLKPDSPEAWHNKGYVLNKLGKPDDALEAFDKAIELKPDDHEAWFNKACSFALKNDKKNMLSCLAKAIELDPICKQHAQAGSAFETFRDDPDFKKLVE
ncbi:MAG: tetratricopeptide repeat protein [bacterium]|nr:tetratricopeptide repeat protein [bacterium]